ncbi:MAG: hypothetical protein ACI9R3_004560, partial [Verrucomicrobiales bacterium]
VSRNTDTTNALTVTLSSGDTSEATVPASVTIAAGQLTSSAFNIDAVDDAIVDGTQTVTITASATAHANGTDTVDVTDDDTAGLTVSIVAASVSEGAGTAATTATVSRNTDTTNALTVTLSSSDTSEATVPASVTIAAGQLTSSAFNIDAVDDAIVDGTQTVTITASATAHANGTDTVDVTDDDTAGLTVSIVAASVSEGAGTAATTATVSRNTDTTNALTVTLSSSDTSEITVPPSITIAAGQTTSSSFDLDAVSDAIADAAQTVTITATAVGHSDGTDTVIVNSLPFFTKEFSPDQLALHSSSVSKLTFTINNSGSTVSATSLDFTDNFPSGFVIADTPDLSTSCTGGTLTGAAGGTTVSYTGGSVSAGGSCTVSIDVKADSTGVHVNTSGALTSSLGNSGTASDTLTVVNASPTINAPASVSIATNTDSAIAGISVADTDSTTLKVTLTATQGTVSANSTSGATLMFTDTTANLNTILAGVKFQGTLNVVGGGSNLRVTVDDLSAAAENHDVVITLIGNSYETWRFDEFAFADVIDPLKEATVWGDLARPAHDMFENLFKFVHGLDPQTPVFDPQVILGTAEVSGQTHATYTFVQRKDLSGVSVSLETASDVTGAFSPLAASQQSVVPISGEPLFELATYTDDQSVGVDAPRFGFLQADGGSPAKTEIFVTSCTDIFGTTATESEHYSFLGLTAVQPKRYDGLVTSAGAATLSDNLANWSGAIFSAKPHYVRITSGSGNGLTADILSHSSTELTLSDDLSGLISAGDAFEIRPHTTLGRVFGEMNSAGLTEGLNASDADNLLLPDPSGAVRRFFYSNAPLDTGWKTQTYSNAADETLLPEGGFIISRKQTGSMRLYQQGARRIGALNAPVEQGFNLISIVSAKRTFSLANSGLFTGDPATGVTTGANANDADVIWAIDSNTGQVTRYFHNGTQWLDNQFNPSDSFEFDPDDSYYIQRKPRSGVPSASNGFNWLISDAIPGI